MNYWGLIKDMKHIDEKAKEKTSYKFTNPYLGSKAIDLGLSKSPATNERLKLPLKRATSI